MNKEMVLIQWHDAKFCPGSHTEEEALKHEMALFDSLGYLVSKDELTTFLATEQDSEGKFRDITLIPTGSIVSIKKLQVVP